MILKSPLQLNISKIIPGIKKKQGVVIIYIKHSNWLVALFASSSQPLRTGLFQKISKNG